jgi:enoyl-CoA hydratase
MAELLVQTDGAVVTLVMNRPEQRNAIGTATIDLLVDALRSVAADSSVGAVVIAGEGKAFCAGADIAEFSCFEDSTQFGSFIHKLADAYAVLQRLPQPSIAAVHGLALGGGLELALACDLRIGERNSRLGVPEIKLGILPGAGGTARLTRMLPPGVAKHLLMTGEPLAAPEAHRLGLLNELVEDGQSRVRAQEIAALLAEFPPRSLEYAKRLVDEGSEMTLEDAVVFERELVCSLFDSADRVEGVAAFMEKRPAVFRHP